MQLDVEESTPASDFTPVLKLAIAIMLLLATCSPDLDLHIIGPVEFWSDKKKAMHKSPPCIHTGGLENQTITVWGIQIL